MSNIRMCSSSSFELTNREDYLHINRENYLHEFGDDSPKGCMLEVNLEYPKELCNLHNDCLFDYV